MAASWRRRRRSDSPIVIAIIFIGLLVHECAPEIIFTKELQSEAPGLPNKKVKGNSYKTATTSQNHEAEDPTENIDMEDQSQDGESRTKNQTTTLPKRTTKNQTTTTFSTLTRQILECAGLV